MDPLRERVQGDAATNTSVASVRSSRAASSPDDALSSQFGDGELDDVVWDDANEYERLHDARGGDEALRSPSESAGREDDRHADRSSPTPLAADSPISDSPTATVTSMDSSAAPLPRVSSLLSAEGITQADDARLADLLRKCLGSRTDATAVADVGGLGEHTWHDGGIHEAYSEEEYEDDYEDGQEEGGPEEESEAPPGAPSSRWQARQSVPSSASASPLPSSSSASSARRPVRNHDPREPFSMEQFMRGAITASSSGQRARSSLQPGISPSRVAQMTNRFRLHEERRARRLAAKRRDAEAQQRLGFSYAPSIDGHSRRLTRHAPAFLERQRSFLTRKQQHAEHEAAKQQQVGDRALELQARVRTPCICSRGGSVSNVDTGDDSNSSAAKPPANPPRFDAGGLRSPVGSSPAKSATVGHESVWTPAGSGHSHACQRFMAMCEKMNASFEIQRKKERMRRSVDDMLAFQRGKQQRQQARAAQLLALETQEETFAPRINPQSERICAAMVESGRLDAEITRRVLRPRRAIPLPPRLTFQPTISNRSKRLAAADPNAGSRSPDVFARLHSPSVWQAPPALDAGRSLVKGSVGAGKAAAREATLASDIAPEVWTEVQLDMAKHAFILHGLELDGVFT